ncbi:MAG: hypothetical protein GY757_09975 [bacterium]|nr:hypothetical protein [bacterium]
MPKKRVKKEFSALSDNESFYRTKTDPDMCRRLIKCAEFGTNAEIYALGMWTDCYYEIDTTVWVEIVPKIIMTLHPQWFEPVRTAAKTFELRTKVPPVEFSHVLFAIKDTGGEIPIECKVKEVHALPPIKLWRKTKHANGMTKEGFFAYFNDRETGYAIEFETVKELKPPKNVTDYGLKKAPQCFAYAKEAAETAQISTETIR